MNHIKTSAPGSTMLLGEYAVLHEGWALVCAVDQRVSVELIPRADDQIEIISSLGTHKTTVKQLELVPPFQFVIAVLKKFQKQLKNGCTLNIQSEFSEKIGLASSAAVTVATLYAMMKWLKFSDAPMQLIRDARSIIQQVQGNGSGADVAACVLGGAVAYHKQPLAAEKLSCPFIFNLIYSGHKTPTSIAVNQVETYFASYPVLYKQLLRAIDACAQQGIAALKSKNQEALGQVMTIQQGLMQALGVNTPILQGIVDELISMPTILGAKISGSGFGDSIISLGTLNEDYISRFAPQGAKQIPMKIATEGVRYEKI